MQRGSVQVVLLGVALPAAGGAVTSRLPGGQSGIFGDAADVCGDANAGCTVVAVQGPNPVHPSASSTSCTAVTPTPPVVAARILAVELSGIEPLASGLPDRRSSS